MTTYLKLIIVSLACALMIAGLVYHFTRPTFKPAQAVDGIDISDSVPRNCGCLVAQVKKKFNDPAMAHGSVTIIASGNESSADEPTLVGNYDVPSTRRVIEGPKATQRKQDALLAELKTKCEALSVTKRSPIALLIRRGLERLQHAGCGPELPSCELTLQSDAEETSEPTIKKLLERSGPIKESKPLFDNTGITVTFVNMSETIGAKEDVAGRRQRLTRDHDSARVQRIQEVWRSLFKDPARVHFEPFCPAN